MKPPFSWDSYSDQPYQITDKVYKKQQQKLHTMQYIMMLVKFLLVLPFALLLGLLPKKSSVKTKIGLGVNLDKGKQQQQLVSELGVDYLIIRLPLCEIDKLDEYDKFIQTFENKDILINILQDRENIDNPALLTQNMRLIFSRFQGRVAQYQIGNAINRSKWGFFAMSEYLSFYQTVQDLRDQEFSQIKLIGSSVIDFEYYHTVASLFHFRPLKFDVFSSLLYVDRRGAPQNSQYGFFDTHAKMKLLYALVRLSNKTNNAIYITEVNWPLSGTKPYAPTSEFECVNETDYCQYMQDYYAIAKQTGNISRVYWHQLIAPGYGLVDNRDGKLRKTPAFYAFKQMIADENSH